MPSRCFGSSALFLNRQGEAGDTVAASDFGKLAALRLRLPTVPQLAAT
jgi:hypothetical protein